ncbi:hypothetical protein V1477_011227, partial [Vespula maculifrons]
LSPSRFYHKSCQNLHELLIKNILDSRSPSSSWDLLRVLSTARKSDRIGYETIPVPQLHSSPLFNRESLQRDSNRYMYSPVKKNRKKGKHSIPGKRSANTGAIWSSGEAEGSRTPNVLRRGDPESGREECRQRSVGPLPEEQVSLLLDRRLLESLLRKVNRFVKKLAKLMRDERRREEGREGGRGRGRGEGGSGEEERGRYP